MTYFLTIKSLNLYNLNHYWLYFFFYYVLGTLLNSFCAYFFIPHKLSFKVGVIISYFIDKIVNSGDFFQIFRLTQEEVLLMTLHWSRKGQGKKIGNRKSDVRETRRAKDQDNVVNTGSQIGPI